jgi:hypothetical protein
MARMVFDTFLSKVKRSNINKKAISLPTDKRMVYLKEQIKRTYLGLNTGNDSEARQHKASLNNLLELSCDIIIDDFKISKNKPTDNPKRHDWAA